MRQEKYSGFPDKRTGRKLAFGKNYSGKRKE